jgi:hypothetical protein
MLHNLVILQNAKAKMLSKLLIQISTSRYFQNGHHNTTKIQHCLISKVAFDLFF